ncbi:hypothetical protein BGZ51_003399 [Haplosporangium sp. Z 767]|nr:hypothetical protein BGZ51_003399 [Haplosporangium sp. Z 767]KAF9185015.1 hypothetical protein BGZ50_003339 [Haplosporangium sp. Z 11]
MDQLVTLFPQRVAADLQRYFDQANGNLAQAIDLVLNGNDPEPAPAPPRSIVKQASVVIDLTGSSGSDGNPLDLTTLPDWDDEVVYVEPTSSLSLRAGLSSAPVSLSSMVPLASSSSTNLPLNRSTPFPLSSSARSPSHLQSISIPTLSATFSSTSPSSSASGSPTQPGTQSTIGSAVQSFDDFHLEQQQLLEEKLRKEIEAEEHRRLLIENFITLARSMFKNISTEFVRTLMEINRPKVASEDELVDACIEAITKMKGDYPKTKRKRHVHDVGDRYQDQNEAGGSDNEDSDDDDNQDQESGGAGPSSSSNAGVGSSSSTRPRDYMDCRIPVTRQYILNCKHQLMQDFLKISSATITACLRRFSNHYAPTFDYLSSLWTGYEATNSDGKGKGIANRSGEIAIVEMKSTRKLAPAVDLKRLDPEFLNEWKWVQNKVAKERTELEAIEAEEANLKLYTDLNELIECACCFDDVPPNRVSQCQEGHLFCLNCSRRGAEVEIGYQRTVLKCMSPGCTSSFSDSEAKKFLSTAVFEGLLRARQQQELKMAGLAGLVECPFCPYAAEMENDQDKEFRCQARKCQNRRELEKNNVLLAQHRVEEEMSQALIRECPNCKKRFFKTEGK